MVIPTYDEAENLGRLLPALRAALHGSRVHILIVDDSADDATARVVDRFRGEYGNVSLDRRAGRRGLGTALREGLVRALADPRCTHICTLDADLSHDPAQLPSLLASAEHAAFVQGSRYIAGGRVLHWSWSRQMMSRGVNWLCRLLGSRLREHTTNYRVYDRRAAAAAVAKSAENGFEWIVSTGLAIQAAGLPIAEVPITFKGREAGESKLGLAQALRYIAFLFHTLGGRVGSVPGRLMAGRAGWLPLDQSWFRWGLAAHLAVLFLLAHVYDMAVFQDASSRLARGEGVYAPFLAWFSEHGDGYYAYPPLYAYMLWVSGRLATAFGGHWWIHQLLIKGWMFLADLTVFLVLRRSHPAAARTYWTLWFVPVIVIAQVQPDLWVGGSVLLAFHFARRARWVGVGLALAVGIGLKATPLVILPFLFAHLARMRQWDAAWRAGGALAAGLVAIWIPYIAFYDDAAQFGQAFLFHVSRPAFGLNLAGGLRSLIDATVVVDALAGNGALAGAATTVDRQVGAMYPLITLLAFAALGIVALTRRWGWEQVFGLPLLTFLLANKVVNEQYLLHVMPLLLVTAPVALSRLVWPYSIYLLTAGTPLRFFPREYGFPLAPEGLLPAALQASAAPAIALALSSALAGSALLFSFRVFRLVQGLVGGRPAGTGWVTLSRPTVTR